MHCCLHPASCNVRLSSFDTVCWSANVIITAQRVSAAKVKRHKASIDIYCLFKQKSILILLSPARNMNYLRTALKSANRTRTLTVMYRKLCSRHPTLIFHISSAAVVYFVANEFVMVIDAQWRCGWSSTSAPKNRWMDEWINQSDE